MIGKQTMFADQQILAPARNTRALQRLHLLLLPLRRSLAAATLRAQAIVRGTSSIRVPAERHAKVFLAIIKMFKIGSALSARSLTTREQAHQLPKEKNRGKFKSAVTIIHACVKRNDDDDDK